MAEAPLVWLVSLPFYSAFASCYQIELLGALLRERGYDARTIHANYEFGALMEQQRELHLYKKLTSVRYFGDYLYLARRYHERAAQIMDEMRRVVPESDNYSLAQYKTFYRVINHIHSRLLERAERERPAVVGLSATHYQLVPSLLLAHQLRRRLPETKIVLGGYLSSQATARDLLRLHEELDWIVYGEAEVVLPELLDDLLAGRGEARGVRIGERARVSTTLPDYGPFIEAGPAQRDHTRYVAFNFELSRGCYWDKCNFCNFNATYGSFRKFDSEPVVEELDRLNREFGARRFQFLDTSLPPRFADYLIREQVVRPDYDIFCELMIDFDRQRLAALRDFGVHRVQVGIESFSSDHLRAMVKNADLFDNVQFLRDCRDLDIEPVYGLMVNVPNETLAHLEEMLVRMRQLRHLPPPKYVSDFDARPESPAFRERERYACSVTFVPGIFDAVLPQVDHNCELRPSRVDFGLEGGERRRALLVEIEAEMNRWRAAWKQTRPRLCLEDGPEGPRVIDERRSPSAPIPVSEVMADLLRRTYLRQARARLLASEELELERAREAGWVIEEGGELMSVISLPEPVRAPAREPLVQLRVGRPGA
jgi:hypothetical protein